MAACLIERRVCGTGGKMFMLLCAFVIGLIRQASAANETEKTIAELYESGVQSYLEERWADCIYNFETSLERYRSFKQTTVNCRVKCQEDAENSPLMFPENIENLHFYEKMIKKTLCLLKCKKLHLNTSLATISKDTEQKYEELKPYEYLHLCYFQKNLIQQAASAVFTYLVVNPDAEMMLKNLKFYAALPEVDVDQIVNFEAQNFVSLYVHGSEAYHNEDYNSVVNYLEESLEDYLKAEEDCRAYCEGPFDQGWFPDFTSSISNHFTYCLKCKHKCPSKLNTLNGERHEDLLASHYHFLQIAYYKVGDLKKACEAVATYLLFFPSDETMLSNKEIYSKMPKVVPEFFTPREEAVTYLKRQEYESALLHYIEEEFVFLEDSKNEVDTPALENSTEIRNLTLSHPSIILKALSRKKLYPPPIIKFEWPDYQTKKTKAIKSLHSINHLHELTAKEDKLVQPAIQTQEEKWLKERKTRAVLQIKNTSKKKIKVVMGEKELQGRFRFLADGFAEKEECQKLIKLAEAAGKEGDGYGGRKSPHTDLEIFEGLGLARTALLVYLGLLEPEVLQLFLDLSETGRHYVERYFNLKKELHSEYTHLVCRTAKTGYQNGSELSHPVHADSCKLQLNGDCMKDPTAFSFRDYSAILYLNDDFEGGEFIFASDITARHIQSTVKPKCGRLVGFSSGGENPHGVYGVRHGKRCAVAMWYTLNPTKTEVQRQLAYRTLAEVKEKGTISEQLLNDLNSFAH